MTLLDYLIQAGVDIEKGEIQSPGPSPMNFTDMISIFLKEFLEEKSELYHMFKHMGIEFDFKKCVVYPEDSLEGNIKTLIANYNKDMHS